MQPLYGSSSQQGSLTKPTLLQERTGTEGQQAYRGHAGTCAGRSDASRSQAQLPSCLTSFFTCQVEISCHPPESEDQVPEDQRFPKKGDKAPKSPPLSPALSSAPSALGVPQQPHHAEASPSPHFFSVEARTEQTLATSSFAVLPLSTVETVPLERARACSTEQPTAWCTGHITDGRGSQLPGSSLDRRLVHPAGWHPLPLVDLGEHPCPCQGFASSTVLCGSQPRSWLSPPNHSHSAVSKETSQAAEKRRDRRHSFPWGLALNLVP